MRVGVRDEGQARVVGDVEPLVRVGGPRVGASDAGDEVSQRRRGRRPQAEGAVDVDPGAVLGRRVAHLVERVEGAAVDLAGLRAHDRRARRAAASAARSAAGRMLPSASVSTRTMLSVPRPSSRTARRRVTWRSALASRRTGGAPVSPRASTSQPARASTWWRAAARPVAWAI